MRPPPSYDVQPQGGYQSPPLPLGFGQNSIHSKTDSAGKIYVGGMPPSLSEAHLHVYFSQFGTVLNVTLIRDRDTGTTKNSWKLVRFMVCDLNFSREPCLLCNV